MNFPAICVVALAIRTLVEAVKLAAERLREPQMECWSNDDTLVWRPCSTDGKTPVFCAVRVSMLMILTCPKCCMPPSCGVHMRTHVLWI